MAIMSLFVVIVAAAMTQPASATQPAAEPSCSGTQDQKSLLSNMLLMTGYNEACVATALDVCSSSGKSPYASLIEEARQVVQQVSAAVTKWDTQLSAGVNTSASLPRHCRDLHASGDSGRGTRQVYPDPARPLHSVAVVCDHTVDGGGWTVFQRRTSDAQRQNFSRTWREYEDGFGDKDGEFWLGLKVLHQLTSTGLHQLRIDLHDYEGEHRWAKYGNFTVEGPETHYRLNVAQYSGDAGDSLRRHNGEAFTTHDADHDRTSFNCATRFGNTGWWYHSHCHNANLNGYQYVGSDSPGGQGIVWEAWKGSRYSLKKTTMMTRPE